MISHPLRNLQLVVLSIGSMILISLLPVVLLPIFCTPNNLLLVVLIIIVVLPIISTPHSTLLPIVLPKNSITLIPLILLGLFFCLSSKFLFLTKSFGFLGILLVSSLTVAIFKLDIEVGASFFFFEYSDISIIISDSKGLDF
jgi:hypothetical protein